MTASPHPVRPFGRRRLVQASVASAFALQFGDRAVMAATGVGDEIRIANVPGPVGERAPHGLHHPMDHRG